MNSIVSAMFVLLVAAYCTEAREICESQSLSSNSYRYVRQTVSGALKVNSIRLTRQISNAPCVENVSFGSIGPDVFVDRGCRGVFQICYETGSTTPITCESNNFREARCTAGGNIRLVTLQTHRSNSPCVEGFSYYSSGRTLVVNKGCRATFLIGL